jgi:hypothetical protein
MDDYEYADFSEAPETSVLSRVDARQVQRTQPHAQPRAQTRGFRPNYAAVSPPLRRSVGFSLSPSLSPSNRFGDPADPELRAQSRGNRLRPHAVLSVHLEVPEQGVDLTAHARVTHAPAQARAPCTARSGTGAG